MKIQIPTIQRQHILGDTSYPFRDSATFLSKDDQFVAPTVFKDAVLYPVANESDWYISKIEFKFTGAVIYISSANATDLVCDVSSYSSGTSFPVTDKFGREVGLLVLEPLQLMAVAAPNSVVTFNDDAMPFVPTVIFPQGSGAVSSLGDVSGRAGSGDLWLIGENGVVLEVSGNSITFNASGDPLYVRKFCQDEGIEYTVRRPLKGIKVIFNGGSFNATPDDYGNIQFRVPANDGIFRIVPGPNSLKFSIVGGAV